MSGEALDQFEAFVEAPARRARVGLLFFAAAFLCCAAVLAMMGLPGEWVVDSRIDDSVVSSSK